MKNMIQYVNRHLIRYSVWAMIGLIIVAWYSVLADNPGVFAELFRAENGGYLLEFLAGMAGVGEAVPAYLDPRLWQNALILSWETWLMSILAIGLASLAMLIFVLPAARHGFWQTRHGYHKILYGLSRFLFLFSRAVPELMWAMILVFIFKPGVLAGALALAIHNFGVLGKLCSEVIENMDNKPLKHLRQNGATQGQILLYGVYPMAIRPFLNYILYRMENIIRASLIVGFVGASGLGLQFKLAMSFFHYSEITLYLICYLLLVYITDLAAAGIKHYLNKRN